MHGDINESATAKNCLGLFGASFAFDAGAIWWIGKKYFAIDRLSMVSPLYTLHAYE